MYKYSYEINYDIKCESCGKRENITSTLDSNNIVSKSCIKGLINNTDNFSEEDFYKCNCKYKGYMFPVDSTLKIKKEVNN